MNLYECTVDKTFPSAKLLLCIYYSININISEDLITVTPSYDTVNEAKTEQYSP